MDFARLDPRRELVMMVRQTAIGTGYTVTATPAGFDVSEEPTADDPRSLTHRVRLDETTKKYAITNGSAPRSSAAHGRRIIRESAHALGWTREWTTTAVVALAGSGVAALVGVVAAIVLMPG